MNQTLEPVTLTFLGTPFVTENYSQVSVTVPPSSLYFLKLNTLSDGQVPAYTTALYWISASAPIRMLAFASKAGFGGDNANFAVPGANTTDPPPVSLEGIYPSTVTWNWQTGKAPPSAATITVHQRTAVHRHILRSVDSPQPVSIHTYPHPQPHGTHARHILRNCHSHARAAAERDRLQTPVIHHPRPADRERRHPCSRHRTAVHF